MDDQILRILQETRHIRFDMTEEMFILSSKFQCTVVMSCFFRSNEIRWVIELDDLNLKYSFIVQTSQLLVEKYAGHCINRGYRQAVRAIERKVDE